MNRTLRMILIAVGVIVAVVMLVFLYEWAGDLLDSGGAIGT
jgi:uncharacterized membrane protein